MGASGGMMSPAGCLRGWLCSSLCRWLHSWLCSWLKASTKFDGNLVELCPASHFRAAPRWERRLNIELSWISCELWEARSRLCRSWFLQGNSHWKAFFEIYKIDILLHRADLKISIENRHILLREWRVHIHFFEGIDAILSVRRGSRTGRSSAASTSPTTTTPRTPTPSGPWSARRRTSHH